MKNTKNLLSAILAAAVLALCLTGNVKAGEKESISMLYLSNGYVVRWLNSVPPDAVILADKIDDWQGRKVKLIILGKNVKLDDERIKKIAGLLPELTRVSNEKILDSEIPIPVTEVVTKENAFSGGINFLKLQVRDKNSSANQHPGGVGDRENRYAASPLVEAAAQEIIKTGIKNLGYGTIHDFQDDLNIEPTGAVDKKTIQAFQDFQTLGLTKETWREATREVRENLKKRRREDAIEKFLTGLEK